MTVCVRVCVPAHVHVPSCGCERRAEGGPDISLL